MNAEKGLCVVLGASGGLGNAMVHVLAEAGERVRAVNRGGNAEVPEGVELHAADLSDADSTRTACDGAAVVYMCANAPYDKWPKTLPPMMRNVINATAAAGAKMVFGDNLYSYGYVDGLIHEDSPRKPMGTKGKIRLLIEDHVLEAHASGRIKATIGRASDFYGPHVMAWGDLLAVPILKGGAAKALGKIDLPHTWSYTRDFAKGLHILGLEERALGEIWHVPSAETITTRQLIEMIYEEAGTRDKLKIQTIGSFLVTIMGLFNPVIRELKEMMYEWNEPYIVDHSKFENAFGNPSTPHREAIRKTLDWFRRNPA